MTFEPMDCGDTSCEFEGRGVGGQRTNGGCRCLKDLDFDKRMKATGYIRHLEAEIRRLRHQLSLIAAKGVDGTQPLFGFNDTVEIARAALRSVAE